MKESLRNAVTGWGLRLPSMRHALWVHGGPMLDFLVAQTLIQSILDARPHVGLVATATPREVRRALGRLFPDELTLAVPRRLTLAHWLDTLQVRHLLLLDGGRSLPGGLLKAAADRNLPISAVNLADAWCLSDELLEISRRQPGAACLCVQDRVVRQELMAKGVPARQIHETGSLFSDRKAHRSGAALRRRLAINDQRRVVAMLDVPADEERALIEAYAEARRHQPRLHLLWESRAIRRTAEVQRQLEARGMHVATTTSLTQQSAPAWEVLIASAPGEAATLLPLADVVWIGGSHGGHPSGAVAAFAAAAGKRTLIGACRDFTTVPWRLLRRCPDLEPVSIDHLAQALARADRIGEVSHPPPGGEDAARRTHDALQAWLPRPSSRPETWRLPTWRDRIGSSGAWQLTSRPLRRGRIESWDALAAHLDHPRTVLCLGNGPSSEDPRLQSLAHDCLIRVNWRWQKRGFLVKPQIVFVGDPATVQHISGAVFGFWNCSLEQGMLLRHLITRGLERPRYITMERLSASIRDQPWPARPSNGALMIDAAVALRPTRLIIAGLDGYRHPEGRYPGDLFGTNAYSRVHTHATDLAIIRTALSHYHGELIVLSDALRSELTNAQG